MFSLRSGSKISTFHPWTRKYTVPFSHEFGFGIARLWCVCWWRLRLSVNTESDWSRSTWGRTWLVGGRRSRKNGSTRARYNSMSCRVKLSRLKINYNTVLLQISFLTNNILLILQNHMVWQLTHFFSKYFVYTEKCEDTK